MSIRDLDVCTHTTALSCSLALAPCRAKKLHEDRSAEVQTTLTQVGSTMEQLDALAEQLDKCNKAKALFEVKLQVRVNQA